MLKDAVVKLESKEPTEDALKNLMSVQKAHDTFSKMRKDGGVDPFKMLTYNPVQKKFGYQTIRNFKNNNESNKVVGIELFLGKTDDGKDMTYEVIVAASSKLYGMANGRPTSILASSLSNYRLGQLSIAYVPLNKEEVRFCAIKRTFDPVVEAKKKADAEPKKRGRKRKEDIAATFDTFYADTRDGSFIVCDNLIMR